MLVWLGLFNMAQTAPLSSATVDAKLLWLPKIPGLFLWCKSSGDAAAGSIRQPPAYKYLLKGPFPRK